MKLLRCKACGYVIREGQLRDACPACGVDRKFFEPYTSTVAERRRKILGLHLHPVAVHFPTSFAAAILVCWLLALLAGMPEVLVATGRVLAVALPVVTAFALVLGIYDGKLRFRQIKRSQILQKKLALGIALLIVSILVAFTIWQYGILYTWLNVILAAGAVALTAILGLLGTSVNESILPGK